MVVEIHWNELDHPSEGWRRTGCLYAYTDPDTDRILYIGKADGTTIRQRFTAADKDDLFGHFKEEFGITEFGVFAGLIALEEGRRLTRELLADIESLLIKRVQPPGNVQSKRSRIARPGLVVECLGEWAHHRTRFVDRN